MNTSLNSWLRSVCTAFGLALALGGPAFSGVVYQDNFNRTGALSGTSPTVNVPAANYTSFGGASGYYTTTTSGGYAYNGNVTPTSKAIAYLPLTMLPGVYNYSLTLQPTAAVPATSGDWLAMGFSENAVATSVGQEGYFPDSNPQLWVLYRNWGGTRSFYDGGTSNGLAGGSGTAGAANRISLTLDSVSGAFTITDSLNLYNRSGTLSAGALAKVHYIGFSTYYRASGKVSDLNLSFTPAPSAVPEPGTLAMGTMGGLLGLTLLRRRRRAA